MKRTADTNLTQPHRPSFPAQLAAQPAPARPAPVLREADAVDHFSALPPELRSVVCHFLASRSDRSALLLTSRDHYASGHPRRSLDFFLMHCRQIDALPRTQILNFSPSALSQAALDDPPGATTLVTLYKLDRLLRTNPRARPEAVTRLNLTPGEALRTGFALFGEYARSYVPLPDDPTPLLKADFLCSPLVLNRVLQLTTAERSPATALALTDALLTWTEHHGDQDSLMDVGDSGDLPLPSAWHALGTLTQHLLVWRAAQPDNHGITPACLLRLTAWAHFVQESGLLLTGATFGDALDHFQQFQVEQCVPALLEELKRAAGTPGGVTATDLARTLLENQRVGLQIQPVGLHHLESLRLLLALRDILTSACKEAPHPPRITLHSAQAQEELIALREEIQQLQQRAGSTQTPRLHHMASLRVFSTLMAGAQDDIAAGSPVGLQLFDATLTALGNTFMCFVIHRADLPVRRFAPAPAPVAVPASDSEDATEDVDHLTGSLFDEFYPAEMIDEHEARVAVLDPAAELTHKLYGRENDWVADINDDRLTDLQRCQLRLMESAIATFRDLSLYLPQLPPHLQHSRVVALQNLARVWPQELTWSTLERWITHPAPQ